MYYKWYYASVGCAGGHYFCESVIYSHHSWCTLIGTWLLEGVWEATIRVIYRPQVAVDFCPQFGAFGKTEKLPSPKITKLLLLWCISTMNKIVIGWCIDLNSFFLVATQVFDTQCAWCIGRHSCGWLVPAIWCLRHNKKTTWSRDFTNDLFSRFNDLTRRLILTII